MTEENIKPIKIFISSPIEEFREERSKIRQELKKIPLTKPLLFEEFAIEPGTRIFDSIKEQIEIADIFIMLMGYWFSPNTMMEFEVARALNKPIFIFIKKLPDRNKDLNNFIENVQFQNLFHYFSSTEELIKKVKYFVVREIVDFPKRFDVNLSDFKESDEKREFKSNLIRIKPDKKLCFVIMPIGKSGTEEYQNFRAIFDYVIKPAVEFDDDGNSTGLKCERADEEVRTGSIPRDIIEKLSSAEIVIADLTNRNANVFYELGVRHSLKQKTIMISQSLDDIPFDISSYRTIKYSPIIGVANDSIKKLRLTVKALIDSDKIKDSPVLDWIQK